MVVVPLMSGAKGEEAHQEYKEEDGSHYDDVFGDYCLMWSVKTLSSLQLFS